MVDIELFWGSPNSRKGPQNHNENGDPGSPFSWGPQNFMTPDITVNVVRYTRNVAGNAN